MDERPSPCQSTSAVSSRKPDADRVEGGPRRDVPAPFIVGAGRSGTTLLRLMLDAHPELAIPPETHFIPNVVERCEMSRDPAVDLRDALLSHYLWPDFHVDGGALTRELRALEPFSVGAGLRAFYRLYAARFGKRRWGDKTPPYMLHMRTIERVLPEARFLHVHRDGRDVALSAMRTWWGPRSVADAAQWWARRVEAARKDAVGLRHYLEIRYDSLVLDTEATLRRVCSFLELPWSASMLEYHHGAGARLAESARDVTRADGKRLVTADARMDSLALARRPPVASRVGRWRAEMSAADRATFEAIAAPTLERLGYPLVSGRVARARARPAIVARTLSARPRRAWSRLAG